MLEVRAVAVAVEGRPCRAVGTPDVPNVSDEPSDSRQAWPPGRAGTSWWTRPWIFGREFLLLVTAITRVDAEEETVGLDHSKEQVKNATGFDEDHHADHREHDDYQAGGFASEPHL
ncbi:hypothetical protein ACIRBX_22465 [Kitasatospora sp. NPDC096147]|uniref:hypothetical protein n=1 Tax=Kitasatospora sp. NPDC096147 TaxID=3364093 RepID=UPI0037F46829